MIVLERLLHGSKQLQDILYRGQAVAEVDDAVNFFAAVHIPVGVANRRTLIQDVREQAFDPELEVVDVPLLPSLDVDKQGRFRCIGREDQGIRTGPDTRIVIPPASLAAVRVQNKLVFGVQGSPLRHEPTNFPDAITNEVHVDGSVPGNIITPAVMEPALDGGMDGLPTGLGTAGFPFDFLAYGLPPKTQRAIPEGLHVARGVNERHVLSS